MIEYQPRGASRRRWFRCLKDLLGKGTFIFLFSLASAAQQPDLSEMSLEDLLNLEITTVGKREQKLTQVPAAVYMITQEDIRRSGATNIPDVLRLVPGVEVAQIDDSNWAVSIRGFNYRSSNKLLVLIDGRTVYYPTYSNVFWDVQDTLMDDIERIEVIRGPGASLWGANAVNGVINIVTKHAKNTEGGLITAGGGNYDKAFTAGRYGGRIGELGHYRIYGKYGLRNHLVTSSGTSLLTGQPDLIRGGFRSDWNLPGTNRFTVQGDLYQGSTPQAVYRSPFLRVPTLAANDLTVSGGDLLMRWTRSAGGSETALQAYYDRSRHPDLWLTQFHEVFDLDFQQQLHLENHDILWGGGFRNTRQASAGIFELSLSPSGRNLRLLSAFLQDDFSLIANRLRLTAGARLEHNGFTGLEVQPTVRLLWTPSPRQAAWAAVSRAVRTPSVWESAVNMNIADVPLPDGTPMWSVVSKAEHLRSEELLAYEIGYRAQPVRQVSLDLALFFQHYNHLSGISVGEPYFALTPSPRLVIPMLVSNRLIGNIYGAEISSTYSPLPVWKLTGSYSWLRQITRSPAAEINAFPGMDGDNPRHQFQIHSYWTLPHHLEADTGLYFVGALPAQGVDQYARWDVRLGWRPTHSLELSIGGQNLLDKTHYEFNPVGDYIVPGKVERSVYGRLTWHF
jgi:iron complex outermembrane receptor protein